MIYILSADTYKGLSVIDENVDDNIIKPVLKKSQNKVKRLLGSDLYDSIITNIDTSSITSDQDTLLKDYVVPYLVSLNDYNIVPFLNYKLTNISISKKNSEQSNNSELNEIKWIRDNVIKSEVMDLEKELVDFLNEEVDNGKYPLFKESRYYECKDNLNSNISQIYIPGDEEKEFRYRNRTWGSNGNY